MGKNVDKNYKLIPALTFSPHDKWLARIRDGKVTVWKVSETNGTLQYEANFPNAQFLAFDRSEKLLFVGRMTHFRDRSSKKSTLITTFDSWSHNVYDQLDNRYDLG